jgi:serine/threonine protein kinase
VFDPESRQLSLRGNPQTAIGNLDLQQCPYCHRPLGDDPNPRPYDSEDEGASSHNQNSFVNPEYFRMLAHSIPSSAATSRPASPLKRLPDLRSGGSRNVTPTGAEFVGSAPSPAATNQGIKDDSFLPNYFKHFFVEKRELGRGGRGVVLLVEHFLDKVFLGEFACKRIPVGNDHAWLEKVLIEVQLLQRLTHPNLVSYHHVWLEDAQITNFGPSVPCIFILQQYCNSGDLHNYVLDTTQTTSPTEVLKERMRRRSKGLAERPKNLGLRTMNFDEIFSFFRDITSGLHHLHTNGYIHRDLKPSNCLLHNDGQKMSVHVSDFGEVQAANEQRTSTGATGTISYCAPEVLQRQGSGFGEFTTKSDIFSLGMIVYFMCFGRLPYQNADAANDENEDLDKLRAEVSAWHGFDDVTRARKDLPEKLYKFLKRLLSPNPAERPSTEQILQAIKAGGEIDDIPMSPVRTGGDQSPDLSNMSSRIMPVDSPAPKKAMRANTNPIPSRPGISQLARHHSGELVHSRSPPLQPRRFSKDVSRSTSTDTNTPSPPDASSLAFRGRDVGTPPGKQPVRLMLPPPPPVQSNPLLAHHSSLLGLKVFLFGFKLFLLSYPCSPFAAKAWLVYPLMGLAILDLTVWKASTTESLLLMVMHVLIVGMARRWSVLCSGNGSRWKGEGLYEGL